MIVRYSPRATRDLESIHEYLNERSPRGALKRYRFKVFYRVGESDSAIEIVHVRHTSRGPWSGDD